MTDDMSGGAHEERSQGACDPALASSHNRASGRSRLLEKVRRLLHGLPGVGVMGGEELRSLPCLHLPDVLIGGKNPTGIIRERHVGQEILGHVLREVYAVAGE